MAHYPQGRRVYDLADELGLLVYAEIPAWHTSMRVLADPELYRTWVEPQLREMIEQGRHHPSVIIWGIANEVPTDVEEGRWFVQNAAGFVKGMDPDRLVTYASDRHEFLPLFLADICFDLVDIFAINEYYGWYYGTMQTLGPALDELHRLQRRKPILVSEFGSETIPGLSNPAPGDYGMDFSEDYQLKFLSTHLEQIFAPSRSEYMAGALLWLYADFPDPPPHRRRPHARVRLHQHERPGHNGPHAEAQLHVRKGPVGTVRMGPLCWVGARSGNPNATDEQMELGVLCHLSVWRDGWADLVTGTVKALPGRDPVSAARCISERKSQFDLKRTLSGRAIGVMLRAIYGWSYFVCLIP